MVLRAMRELPALVPSGPAAAVSRALTVSLAAALRAKALAAFLVAELTQGPAGPQRPLK